MTQLVHHKQVLVNVKDYRLTYHDAETPVFSDLSFTISQKDRIALQGNNGCGKSTLIKMILQKAGAGGAELPVTEEGICETASNLVISYISQDTSDLKGGILTFCEKRHLNRSLFCAILRQLDFDRVQFEKNMEDFSEGQKKKILIAASLLTPAHLYIWDEPLNYIDIFSRMQIEKLILQYQPTMLFVDHDVSFQNKIAERTIRL